MTKVRKPASTAGRKPASTAGRKPASTAGAEKRVRKSPNKWNEKRRQKFIAILSETANVVHSAREVEMSSAAAYLLKRTDPAFARAWREALDVGYSELELSVLRDCIHGTVKTETLVEGADGKVKSVKETHSKPLNTAVGLLRAHRDEVLNFRQEREDEETLEDVAARVRAQIDLVRDRLIAQGMVREEEEDRLRWARTASGAHDD